MANLKSENTLLKMQACRLKQENERIANMLAFVQSAHDRLAQRKATYKHRFLTKKKELDLERAARMRCENSLRLKWRENAELARTVTDERERSNRLSIRLEELEQQRNPLTERLFSDPLILKKHVLIAALDCFKTCIVPFIDAQFRRIHGDIQKNPNCSWLDEIKQRKKPRGKQADVEEQCDIERVSSDSWQFAIMFLKADDRAKYTGFRSLDLSASLFLMICCRGVIPPRMERDAVLIRDLRNLLSHSCLDEELERVHIGSIKDSIQNLRRYAKIKVETPELHEAFALLDSVKEEQPLEYDHCCAILPCSDSENSLSGFTSDDMLGE